MLRRDGDKIVLCGKNSKCCPTVEKIDDEFYKVTDDDGNSIRVKKEALNLIPDAVNVINGEQLLLG
jgi:hypothetical protein